MAMPAQEQRKRCDEEKVRLRSPQNPGIIFIFLFCIFCVICVLTLQLHLQHTNCGVLWQPICCAEHGKERSRFVVISSERESLL